MPTPVPTPLAAALGIVPTVLDHVKRLPLKAVQLPIFAVSSALTGLDSARREYGELAERGERLLARLRGTSFDELEDRFEDALHATPLARPYDRVEDLLEDAAETVTTLARKAPAAAKKAPAAARKAAVTTVRNVGESLDKAADTVEDAAERVADTLASVADTAVDAVKDVAGEAAGAAQSGMSSAAGELTDELRAASVPVDEAPKGKPTPKATEPHSARPDTAASADVVRTVEQVSSVVGGTVLPHAELPLADYDHLTLGSLRGRIRSLDLPQLISIRDYEKAHADRLPIVTMLDNRIAKLASDPTAPLSHGGTDKAAQAAVKKSSKVEPATADAAVNPATIGAADAPGMPR